MAKLVVEARQRNTVRRGVSVECQVVSDREFKLLGERTLDLSTDGLLLRSDAAVELGETALVSLRTPLARWWLDAEATVVRVVQGLRTGDRGRCIALRFEHIDAISRAVLGASLAGLPPPVPGRRLRKDYARTVHLIASSSRRTN